MTALAKTVAIVAMLATVMGCSAGPSKTQLSEQPPQLVAAMPLPEKAVTKAVAQLDRLADELVRSSGIPGLAVAVVHGGKTVYAKGFGVKDASVPAAAAHNQVGADTVFQLASVSKSIAATVVAHEVGVGAVDWNTRVVDRLPWFALSDPAVTGMVTLGDLLAHRSGLPDHAGDKLEDLGFDRHAVLERLRLLPLEDFRISYAYTNFGFTAGALAAASASGQDWENLSRRVLYEPLRMYSTSSLYHDFDARTDKAPAHILIDGTYQPRYHRNPDPQSPAGGVSSSVNDMAHWLTMLLANGSFEGKQVVQASALSSAVTPQIVSSPATEPAMRSGFYGYGFNVGTTSAARVQLSHSGGFELGAATNFLMIPSADVAIVALTNATPCGVPETLTAEFADLVQFGEIRENWRKLYADAFVKMDAPTGALVGAKPPGRPAAAKPLPAYVGSYANDYWGPATVVEKDGALLLSLGPRGATYKLTHWDGDVFTFSFISENSPPGSVSKATFAGDKLTLEYFDDDKMGTFTR
jgi:CubicO group peptidase (beta-lactamase class C family)